MPLGKASHYVKPTDEDTLLAAIRAHDWEQCRRLLIPCTNEVDSTPETSVELLDKLVNFNDEDSLYGGSVLHSMIISDAPVDLVKRIVSLLQCRQILSVRDSDQGTPLHYACSYGSVETVRCLLESDPSQCQTTNAVGQLPLHRAVPHRRSPDGVIRKLLETWPGAVRESSEGPDGECVTPLVTFVNVWKGELYRQRALGFRRLRPYRPVDGIADGRRIARETLGLLVRAFRRGHVVGTDKQQDLHDVLLTADVPSVFSLFLLKTMSRIEVNVQDDRGNFPLHVTCQMLRYGY